VLTTWPADPVPLTDQLMVMTEIIDELNGFSPSVNPAVACLDADRLAFPLTIRPWRQGDRFRPIGLKGNKLISDFLTDLKLPRPEREQINVMVAGEEIVWVVGRRIAHAYRITALTKRVAQFTIQPNH
jgi:tRNA(Ile)-lysidine synthase